MTTTITFDPANPRSVRDALEEIARLSSVLVWEEEVRELHSFSDCNITINGNGCQINMPDYDYCDGCDGKFLCDDLHVGGPRDLDNLCRECLDG